MSSVDLRRTHARGYTPGRPFAVRALWQILESLIFRNPVVVSYAAKRWLLRAFGAEIGADVIIKPGVHVKYPWRLIIGDASWVGERVWIDNMENVTIGPHAVVSQDAYLCTGNHDWSDPGMPLTPRPIVVERGAWVGARASVGPGVVVGMDSVVALGSVVTRSTEPCMIYAGNPATQVGRREFR